MAQAEGFQVAAVKGGGVVVRGTGVWGWGRLREILRLSSDRPVDLTTDS